MSQQQPYALEHHLPIFVYGTLRRGQPNYHRLLRGCIVYAFDARLQCAELYDMGFFPMAVSGSGEIVGELMVPIPHLYDDLMEQLDRLEGVNHARPQAGLYRRLVGTVHAEDRSCRRAWVYLGDEERVQNAQRIACGDWVEYIEQERWRRKLADADRLD